MTCTALLFTKRNKIIQGIKWLLLIEKDYLLAVRGRGLHFCITQLVIRPNCSGYVWSQTKLVDYLVDYPEVSDNLQDKTKLLLSLEKFMQIRTNFKVRSNPERNHMPYGMTFTHVPQPNLVLEFATPPLDGCKAELTWVVGGYSPRCLTWFFPQSMIVVK